MKNKPYKLGVRARKIQDRNIELNIHPDRFKLRETLEGYLARMKKENA